MLCSDYVVFSHATLPGGGEVTAAPAKKATSKKAATVLSADVDKDVVAGDDEPSWPGSVRADGEEAPEGHEIKGNASSMLHHVPGSRYYKATKAEYWFDTVANAEAAGFGAPGADKDDESAGDAS